MGDSTAKITEQPTQKIKEPSFPSITLNANQLPYKDKGVDDVFDLVIKVKVIGVNRDIWDENGKKTVRLQIKQIKKQNYEEEYASHFSK